MKLSPAYISYPYKILTYPGMENSTTTFINKKKISFILVNLMYIYIKYHCELTMYK